MQERHGMILAADQGLKPGLRLVLLPMAFLNRGNPFVRVLIFEGYSIVETLFANTRADAKTPGG